MQTFSDKNGRKWTVEINVGTIKRVKREIGVDISQLALEGFKKLDELFSDLLKFVDVLYLVSSCGAEVSPDEFAESLGGDVLSEATDAFIDGLIAFFPNPRTRQMLAELVKKGKAVRDAGIDQVMDEVKAINPQDVLTRLSNSATNSPALSE